MPAPPATTSAASIALRFPPVFVRPSSSAKSINGPLWRESVDQRPYGNLSKLG